MTRRFFAACCCLVSLLLASGLAACSSFSEDAPPVADSTMVEVLIELRLAEARHALRRDLDPALRDSILAHYDLDAEAYEEVVAFYADHPQAYVNVYTTLLDRLSAQRDERAPTALPDSVQRLDPAPDRD